jgi:hypothetical protein
VARDELFELAVNRALTYARRVRLDLGSAERLSAGLEVWYLKTRFAYRVPLAEVVAALLTHPGAGAAGATWDGGPDGGWRDAG